ncbi:MAG: hypothetical protein HC890_11845 [Chloroflexaceae bacterium]|nr:hypothetical protein [Chloroflexaceae bacterium]
MSKRRNPKKEKAARNQAYARQFRKRTSRSFSRGRSYSNSKDETGGGEEAAEKQ